MKGLVRKQWRIQGEGPGGLVPPIRPDACLRLKFLHRQDCISLFNWLIFLNETSVAFCHYTKFQGYSKMLLFWVPPYDLYASARKAVFPAPMAVRGQGIIMYNQTGERGCGGCGGEVICHKKAQQSFLNQSLPPPPPPPRQSKIPRSAPENFLFTAPGAHINFSHNQQFALSKASTPSE